MDKRSLLNERVVDIARYLQTEYLKHNMLFLKDQNLMYDRSNVEIILEEHPRQLLTHQTMLEQFNKRYVYIISCTSPTIASFLDGFIPFNDFYNALLKYILELEEYISVPDAQKADPETRLSTIVKDSMGLQAPVIYKGRQMRAQTQLEKTNYELAQQTRSFIYPFNLTLEAVGQIIAFERGRGTLLDTLIAQQPDDIISVYDQYAWVKKELIRRGVFVQKIDNRISLYDNTWLNLDIPKTLELTVPMDKTNRGIGFESLAFREKQIIIRKLIDWYYWGIENNGTKTASQGVKAPDGVIIQIPGKIRGSFVVAMSDIGIGPTAREPEQVEREDLSGATLEDLKHLIQKIFIQQLGATSVTFNDERYESSTQLIQIRLRTGLFEVNYELDEAEVASLQLK